jgi:hypothetical protein
MTHLSFDADDLSAEGRDVRGRNPGGAETCRDFRWLQIGRLCCPQGFDIGAEAGLNLGRGESRF